MYFYYALDTNGNLYPCIDISQTEIAVQTGKYIISHDDIEVIAGTYEVFLQHVNTGFTKPDIGITTTVTNHEIPVTELKDMKNKLGESLKEKIFGGE